MKIITVDFISPKEGMISGVLSISLLSWLRCFAASQQKASDA
jgi:hypothetical protein